MEIYAKHFQIYSPIFDRQLEQMNKKALIRLAKLLVTFPLEHEHLKPLGKSEKDTFHIADELLKSKYAMVLFAGFEAIQKEEDLKRVQKEAGQAATTDSSGD